MRNAAIVLFATVAMLIAAGTATAGDACVDCHTTIAPGLVEAWRASTQAANDVTCETFHGDAHVTAEDSALARLPDLRDVVIPGNPTEVFGQFTGVVGQPLLSP